MFLLSGSLLACSSAPTDETPSGALRLFVGAMERSASDEGELREAYLLLAAESRRGLRERAHLASALGGRRFHPWEMIVQGQFRLELPVSPEGDNLEERIEEDRATVVVRGRGGARAEVPLVREEGRWRLLLHLPAIRSPVRAPSPQGFEEGSPAETQDP